MKNVIILLIFNAFAVTCSAQDNSETVNIAGARLELKRSILSDDIAGAGLWMDSLAKIESETYAALIWDEKWLLYFWSGTYGNLLEEVAAYDMALRDLQAYRVAPPEDSLFALLDSMVLERRFDYYQQIQKSFLNQEEKALSILILDYLLRLNPEEELWLQQLNSFERLYPNSRFLPWIRAVKPDILQPTNKAFGLAIVGVNGRWSGQLDRSFNPLWGGGMDGYYWQNRWSANLNFIFGGARLARDLGTTFKPWPKGETANVFLLGLDAGYDVLHNSKFRLFPSLGLTLGSISPTIPAEDEEPNPDYYSDFEYLNVHFTTTVTADIKMFTIKKSTQEETRGSFHGIRIKAGYHWMNFGNNDAFLQGRGLIFSLGYHYFMYFPAKRK